MTTQLDTVRVPSQVLTNLINEANSNYGRSKELIVEAYYQALKEDYTQEEAKKLLLDRCKIFGRSTIYACLPEECKGTQGKSRTNITSDKSPNLDKNSAEHEFNTKDMGVVVTSNDEPYTPPIEPVETQSVDCPSSEPAPDVNTAMLNELREEIKEKDKALDEIRREMNTIIAANPNLEKNPDLYKNLREELSRITLENEELKSQIDKPEFVRASDIQDKPEPRKIVPHKRLLEIRSAIIQTGADGDLEFVWDEQGNFVGVNVV